MMIAQVCDLETGDFVHTLGDTHLYLNHIEQAKAQLKRFRKEVPQMTINPKIKNIDEFSFEDFNLINYNPDAHIKASVAI